MRPIDRRRFAQLSTLALAATRLSAQRRSAPAPSAGPRIGFAPVGLGSISNTFMKSLPDSQHCAVTGVVTGHPADKGKFYADRYKLPQGSIYTYETYNSIRDNKAIDAVYIGLPNAMHCEYTVRAAEAGKHVLCEKPMAISSAECRRMIDACRSANVKLMVAYRLHFDPFYDRVRSLVTTGALGEIVQYEGSFPGFQPIGAWRLDRALSGGGSLFDLGIYPLNGMRFLTGEEPSEFHGVVSTREQGARFAQVEQTVAWNLRFPSGILASGSSSYNQNGENFLTVRGTKGWLTITSAFAYEGQRLTGKTITGNLDETSKGKRPFQFTNEADHFAQCILNNTAPLTGGDEGLKDLLAIEAIYKAAGTPVA